MAPAPLAAPPTVPHPPPLSAASLLSHPPSAGILCPVAVALSIHLAESTINSLWPCMKWLSLPPFPFPLLHAACRHHCSRVWRVLELCSALPAACRISQRGYHICLSCAEPGSAESNARLVCATPVRYFGRQMQLAMVEVIELNVGGTELILYLFLFNTIL